MYDYEVRVLNADETPAFILPGPYLSVVDALKLAKELAASGCFLEVWRDDERVHHECVAGPVGEDLPA